MALKKMDELMAAMGFNKNAPESVKEAFVKHLIKASTGVHVETPSEKKLASEAPDVVKRLSPALPAQMSFDFGEGENSSKKAVS